LKGDKAVRENIDAIGTLGRAAASAADGRWSAAIGYITESINLGLEEPLPKALMLRGMCFMQTGRSAVAVDDFTDALNVDSSQTTARRVYPLRGRCHCMAGQWERALSDFNDAISACPKNADSFVGRAQCYFNMGELLKAAYDLLQAIKRDPLSADAYYTLGEVFLAKGEIKRAMTVFKLATRAIAPGRRDRAARTVPGRGEGKLDFTIRGLNAAIERNANLAAAYAARAESRRNAEKWELAIEDFCEAIRRGASNKAECLAHRAFCYIAVSKWDLALCDCNQVIPNDSDHGAARLIRGACYAKKREWELAIEDFTVSIRGKPGTFEPYLLRADCHRAQGHKELAAQDLAKATELGWPGK
jgi:tetratricopeptide (TPR) repeat protein